MAKISQLAPADVLHGDDILPVVDVSDASMAATGTTKKVTIDQLLDMVPEGHAPVTLSGTALANGLFLIGQQLDFTAASLGANGAMTTAHVAALNSKATPEDITVAIGLIPDATPSVRGFINDVVQAFKGAKTFSDLLTAASGLATSLISSVGTLALRSDAGGSSSDVATRLGTSRTNDSTHASAALATIGGSDFDSFTFRKNGVLLGTGGVSSLSLNTTVGARLAYGSSAFVADSSARVIGGTVRLEGDSYVELASPFLFGNSRPLCLYAGGTSGLTETVRLIAQRADDGLVCITVGTEQAITNPNAVIFQVAKQIGVAANNAVNGVPFLQVMGDGTVRLTTNGAGAVFKDASGTQYKVTVTNAGVFTIENLSDGTKSVAVTAGAQEFTGGKRGAVVTLLASTGSVPVPLAQANNFVHTLLGNATLAAPTGALAGQSGVVEFRQGATPYTLAFDNAWKFSGGEVPTLTANAYAVDLLAYQVLSDGTVMGSLLKDIKR